MVTTSDALPCGTQTQPTPLPEASGEGHLEDYPDGGVKAWTVLFGCFCSFFAGLSMMNSVGVYQNWIVENQLKDTSISQVGWIFGFSNFFSFFIGLPLGPVFDMKGPRILSACGSLLLLATYLLLGQCSKYWHFFLCFGLVGGLSTGLLFTSAIGSVQHWFFKRRGLATGLAICGGSVGGITSPLILGRLLPEIGFAWTMRAMALFMVPFLICATTLMEGRVTKSKGEDLWTVAILPDLRILLDRCKALLTLGAFCIELGLFIPMTYLVSYAISQSFSTTAAYRITTIMNVGSLLGRLLPGWIGDKLGRFNAQICALILCLGSIFGIWKPAGNTVPGLAAFAFLFGLGSGSGISLVPVCIGQLCKTEEYGRTFTAIYGIGSFGSLVGVPLGGVILDSAAGDYMGLIIFAGLAYLVALGSFLSVRIIRGGLSVRCRY